MFVFQEIWHALFSWNTRFEIRPFALLRTNQGLSLEPPTHMFFCEFCEIFQNSFFIENFRWLLLQIYHLRNANREIDSKKYQKCYFWWMRLFSGVSFLDEFLLFQRATLGTSWYLRKMKLAFAAAFLINGLH